MAKEFMSWEELLSFERFDEYSDEYGPNTQAVVNCFETLDTISWFAAVGAETPNLDVEGVNTWGEALAPIIDRKAGKYGEDGHLVGPGERVASALRLDPYQDAYAAAFADVEEFVDYEGYIPSYFDKPQRAFMKTHLDNWVRNLLVEIIASKDVESTYFRELLPWYEAGHFPCGWDGEWPKGRIRVF